MNDEPLADCNLCEPSRRVFAREVPAHLRTVHGIEQGLTRLDGARMVTVPAALLEDAAYWLRAIALGQRVHAEEGSDRQEVIGIVAGLEAAASLEVVS